jgi:hypothetical protein
MEISPEHGKSTNKNPDDLDIYGKIYGKNYGKQTMGAST